MRSLPLLGLFVALATFGCSAIPPGHVVGAPPPPAGSVASATAPAPSDEASLGQPEKKKPVDARLESEESDENVPEGGLGLAGTGEGGGGRGDGIGLGSIGTLGHGAGSGQGQGYGAGAGKAGGEHKDRGGQVKGATAATSGTGLPQEVIQRVVRSSLGRIRLCYESAMTKDPTLQGKVAVKFVIDGQGSVQSATAEDATITDATMVSCVVGTVKALSFPAPEKAGVMVITYPFTFAPSDS